ncbi:DNA-binding protein [Xylanibacter oryzae]|uniref:HU family DNA-binding protein n=1 Tax=Xylanibacter oryzae TaxID=185293 RepID=UPI0012B6037B|nr:DNA-binding protein [Xylanibacter oryzae]
MENTLNAPHDEENASDTEESHRLQYTKQYSRNFIMPIIYKMKRITAPNTSASGKYYALAQHTGTWRTREVARLIQANCSLKESDVLGVISELVCTMKLLLQDSQRVQLDGFGTFKISITNEPVSSPEDFDPKRNVRSLRIIFWPEYTLAADGSHETMLLDGAQLVRAPDNPAKGRRKGK